jgi:hypothetical protein
MCVCVWERERERKREKERERKEVFLLQGQCLETFLVAMMQGKSITGIKWAKPRDAAHHLQCPGQPRHKELARVNVKNGRAWWPPSVIPARGRVRQEELESEVSQCCSVRLCLKKQKLNKNWWVGSVSQWESTQHVQGMGSILNTKIVF